MLTVAGKVAERTARKKRDLSWLLKNQAPGKPKKTAARKALDREAAKAKREKYQRMFLNQIRVEGLPEPVPEFVFHPTRRWRLDFAWPAHGLALEVDGAVYTGGRHTRGAGYEEDCIKKAEAVMRGFRVLNFSTGQVEAGIAVAFLRRFFLNGEGRGCL